jgi:hypothetical protein
MIVNFFYFSDYFFITAMSRPDISTTRLSPQQSLKDRSNLPGLPYKFTKLSTGRNICVKFFYYIYAKFNALIKRP